MAHDVFISHSSKDKPIADAVCHGLERAGIRCWIAPRDIVPGASWAASIVDAITESRVVIVILSSSSNDSAQVVREVERAVHRGAAVIPLRIEDITPSKELEFFLSAPHWLDALSPPVEQHIARLTETCATLLGRSEGVPRDERREEPGPATGRARFAAGLSRRGAALAAAVAALFVAGGWFAWPDRYDPELADSRIAVLPFTNQSADATLDPVLNALDYEVRSSLAVANIRTLERSVIERHTELASAPEDLGRVLNVRHLVRGVAPGTDRLMLALVDAPTEEQTWGASYRLGSSNLPAVIAEEIARQVDPSFGDAEVQRLSSRATSSQEAYDAYLEGRGYSLRAVREDNEKAVDLFRRALEFDPSYALGYAGLAQAYAQRVQRFGFPQEWADSALVAADRAIALQPEVAEGYEARAAALNQRGEYETAIRTFETALSKKPGSSAVKASLGLTNLYVGRYDEAIRWFREALHDHGGQEPRLHALIGELLLAVGDFEGAARELDLAIQQQPDLPVARRARVYLGVWRGDARAAAQAADEFLALHPDDFSAWAAAADVRLYAHDWTGARELYERARALEGENGRGTPGGHFVDISLAFVLDRLGDGAGARTHLNRFRAYALSRVEQGDRSTVLRYNLGISYALESDLEEGARWLTAAVEAGFANAVLFSANPLLEEARRDPAIGALSERLDAQAAEVRGRVTPVPG